MSRANTTIGVLLPVFDPKAPPSLDVQLAVYPVIVLPFSAGTTKATEICASPRVNVAAAGALGTAAGTADPEGAEAVPLPAALVARTVHV